MVKNLTLQSPTDVSRSSTVTWSNISNLLAAPSSYATIGAFAEPSLGDYARINIATPAPALTALPAYLILVVNAAQSAVDSAQVDVVDDTVQLGLSGGPVGTNVGSNLAYTASDSVRTYYLPTGGITLGQLNSGSVYVFIGLNTSPSTAFSVGNWSVSYSASGAHTVQGTPTSWSNSNTQSASGSSLAVPYSESESGSVTARVSWTAGGQSPAYVVLSVNSQVSSTFSVATSLGPNSATATVQDGFGNTQSISGNGAAAASLNTTQKVRVNLTNGVGTFTLSNLLAGGSLYSPGASGTGISSMLVQVTATPVAPDSSTIRMDGLGLSYALWMPDPVRFIPSIGIGSF